MPKQDSTCIDRHADMRQLTQREIGEVFTCLEHLDDETSGFILLQADERYYREKLFLVQPHYDQLSPCVNSTRIIS